MKLTNFVFADHAPMFDCYEAGYGFRNTPHLDSHVMVQNEDKFIVNDIIDSPYVGFGWYAKKLTSIQRECAEYFPLQHFMNSFMESKLKNMENVYIIFSERRSTQCRPCASPPPTYIGWALCT